VVDFKEKKVAQTVSFRPKTGSLNG